jgi:hypothetical protein
LRARARWLAVAIAAAGSLALVPAARPAGSPGSGTLGDQTHQDTDFTPVAKSGRDFGWTMFDGAEFHQPGDPHYGQLVQKPAPSQTPFTVDFFTVRFDPDPGKGDGFAGGAACKDSSTPFGEKLDGCERVPAIWRFEDNSWQQVALPGGAGDPGGDPTPGYVGALAYMADGKVLAVGGDGVYPRRELACSATAPSGCVDDPGYRDPAGKPRAWLYDGTGWREVSDQQFKNPDGTAKALDGGEQPGGLTALACAPVRSETFDFGAEYCVAGGLHQLWMWQDSFVKTYDDKSTSGWATGLDATAQVERGGWGSFGYGFARGSAADSASGSSAAEFRFRVRDIRWGGYGSFVAVTAGCCSDATSFGGTAGPRLLAYFDPSYTGQWRWSASALYEPDLSMASGSTRGAIADSYYSVVSSGIGGGSMSVVASPGGPAAAGTGAAAGGEPGARIVFDRTRRPVAWQNDSADNADVLDLHLAGVRLVSADGDFARPSGGHAAVTGISSYPPSGDRGVGPDGLLDWAVGSLVSSSRCESAGLSDCQGAAYTTLNQTQLTPSPLTCPVIGRGDSSCDVKKDYASSLTAGPGSSRELMGLPSYALNSITDVPNTDGPTIWAVGDRGAILRLGGNGTVGSPNEPPGPQLGAQQPAALADRGAYDAFRPSTPTGEAGVVPALAAQPLSRLAAPSLLAAGSPDPGSDLGPGPVSSIVMSRDGSEGWALAGNEGSQYGSSTLYHYAGGSWTACDGVGIAGQLAPDRACAGLAGLHAQKVILTTLARVPLEQGADPSNADDFEVVAIGSPWTTYKPRGATSKESAVALYRGGRWELMDGQDGRPDWMAELGTPDVAPGGLVFSAPDDGWLVAQAGTGDSLYHFDGAHWTECGSSDPLRPNDTPHPEACGHSDVLPLFAYGTQGHLHLTVAGRRVYLAGTRMVDATPTGGFADAFTGAYHQRQPYPLIYHRVPGGSWTSDYDRGCDLHKSSDRSSAGCAGSSDPSVTQGTLTAISVAELGGDHFVGWAAGTFGASSTPTPENLSYPRETSASSSGQATAAGVGAGGPPGLLRLDSDHGPPRLWRARDATGDYLVDPSDVSGLQLLSVAAVGGEERAFLLPPRVSWGDAHMSPLLEYDARHDRWQVLPAPFLASQKLYRAAREAGGQVRALAPDGAGGYWLAARRLRGASFYHYTDRWPRPVFSDVAHPVREPIAGTAAGGDGSFWVATASSAVYRYDRVTGWDRMTVSGWDAGRTVTNPSRAYAVAVGADGSGVVVGKGGRVADVGPGGGVLDAASGVLCSARVNAPPCSTSYDLRAAAVGSDGSAIVGGDRMALLWRPAGKQFRAIAKPPEKSQPTITGLSMPSPHRAWLTTDAGQVFAATLGGDGQWSWTLEADAATLTKGFDDTPLRLHAVAIDASGRGLAVGNDGLILERQGDGSWRRLGTGRLDTFYSVALPPGGYGDGALIGGGVGVVLTRVSGRFELARTPDFFDGLATGVIPQTSGDLDAARIIGVAVLPGHAPGEVEAWATSQMQPQPFRPEPWPGAILHYTNAPAGSLLDAGTGRARALPDTPGPPQSGEVSFAAFGKQECQLPEEPTCPEMQGSNLANELIARRVTDAISGASTRSDRPAFAVFTGDADNSAGRDRGNENQNVQLAGNVTTPVDADVIHHRWRELVAQPLRDRGVALFGALGAQDLSQTMFCSPVGAYVTGGGCHRGRDAGNPGPSLPWREAFSGMPAPWGAAKLADGADNKPPPDAHGLSYTPVAASGVEGPSVSASSQTVSTGGAHTHYAVDVERGGKALVRLVVVDTSLRTLSGQSATQNPVEEQLKWLTNTLSSRPAGSSCQRRRPTRTARGLRRTR